MIELAGYDFPEHAAVVVCTCVADGHPVSIYQHAPDGLSMVCGDTDHDVSGLRNICLHHLSDRPELKSLPTVDCGYGAHRDEHGSWNIFEDNEDA